MKLNAHTHMALINEISRMTGMKESTVSSHGVRAVEKLRTLMGDNDAV